MSVKSEDGPIIYFLFWNYAYWIFEWEHFPRRFFGESSHNMVSSMYICIMNTSQWLVNWFWKGFFTSCYFVFEKENLLKWIIGYIKHINNNNKHSITFHISHIRYFLSRFFPSCKWGTVLISNYFFEGSFLCAGGTQFSYPIIFSFLYIYFLFNIHKNPYRAHHLEVDEALKTKHGQDTEITIKH